MADTCIEHTHVRVMQRSVQNFISQFYGLGLEDFAIITWVLQTFVKGEKLINNTCLELGLKSIHFNAHYGQNTQETICFDNIEQLCIQKLVHNENLNNLK